MQRLARKVLSFAAAALLAASAGLAMQSGQEQPPQEPKRQQARALPHVTGTVALWNGDRIDLKTRDGKKQKVAVNTGTERLVEIREGIEVTVDYRRKIGSFVIAERVRPAGESAAAQAEAEAAPGQSPNAVTGEVISWNNAALALRTQEGDVTIFLSPKTEYLIKSLDPGVKVTVEFHEGSDGARLGTHVRAAEESAKQESGGE